uniref:Uncharacterized protein n=1 Tax=viral metagenome TaxID=1070528 RepID=A0A6C0E7B1_9ZZZZ
MDLARAWAEGPASVGLKAVLDMEQVPVVDTLPIFLVVAEVGLTLMSTIIYQEYQEYLQISRAHYRMYL